MLSENHLVNRKSRKAQGFRIYRCFFVIRGQAVGRGKGKGKVHWEFVPVPSNMFLFWRSIGPTTITRTAVVELDRSIRLVSPCVPRSHFPPATEFSCRARYASCVPFDISLERAALRRDVDCICHSVAIRRAPINSRTSTVEFISGGFIYSTGTSFSGATVARLL